MRTDSTIGLFQYWNRLRGDRKAPTRAEIEPADIKHMLADTFILEQDARGEATFRLAGTRLCAIFGRELKGFALASLWTQRDQRVVARLIHGTMHKDAVVALHTTGISRGGKRIALEFLILPLDGGEEQRRGLGCMIADDKPYWLGADPIEQVVVESLRVIDPDREPLFLANRPSISVPPLAPEHLGTQAPAARRVRHLVVLEGGRDD